MIVFLELHRAVSNKEFLLNADHIVSIEWRDFRPEDKILKIPEYPEHTLILTDDGDKYRVTETQKEICDEYARNYIE